MVDHPVVESIQAIAFLQHRVREQLQVGVRKSLSQERLALGILGRDVGKFSREPCLGDGGVNNVEGGVASNDAVEQLDNAGSPA